MEVPVLLLPTPCPYRVLLPLLVELRRGPREVFRTLFLATSPAHSQWVLNRLVSSTLDNYRTRFSAPAQNSRQATSLKS